MPSTSFAPHLLAEKLYSALRTRPMRLQEFAETFDLTYEHSRKIFKGESFPSKRLLKAICQEFTLDYSEMEKLLVADKIRKQHGTIPLELAGKDPRFENFEHILGQLNADQVEDLFLIANAMYQRTLG